MSGIRRRQLGEWLRRLREAAGKAPPEVCEWVGITPSTLSRIETGRSGAKLGHVRLMLQLYGVGSPDSEMIMRMAKEANERGWWTRYTDTAPKWFADYLSLESDAAELWTYHPELLHGLLQTPDYTRAVRVGAKPDASAEELDRFVDLRQARQERLNGGPLWFFVNEASLHRRVGGPDVMTGQIDHLDEISRRPNITLRVLPFAAGAHPAMVSAATLMRFAPGAEGSGDHVAVLYHETDLGCLLGERDADVTHYVRVFDRLGGLALSPDKSRALMAKVRAQFL